MNGKEVECVYSGEHNTETEIVWNANQNSQVDKYLISLVLLGTFNRLVKK